MLRLIESSTQFELSPTLHSNEMVRAKRRAGQDVLHMGFGESPFPVLEKLQNSLKNYVGHNEYLPTTGLPALREVVADYYAKKTGLDTDQYDVFVAPGSKLILYALQMAIEGDLILPVPSWVSYTPQSIMLNRHVIACPTRLDDHGYHIDAQQLKKIIEQARAEGKNPRKIILNYPNNPTGLKIPEETLKEIAEVCVAEDILIISDEIYGFISFDSPYSSIAKFAPTHTAVSTGLSKHISLGGWRIGVSFIPKAVPGLFKLLGNIASETWSAVPAPIQHAVIDCCKGDNDVEAAMNDFRKIHALMNRYVARSLKDLGLECPMPQGAFYCYPNFAPYREKLQSLDIHTSRDLSSHLLEQRGLATLPGVAFGEAEDVLTMRLAGCDYDGAKAWQAYQDKGTLDDQFVADYAPNIKASVDVFKRVIEHLG